MGVVASDPTYTLPHPQGPRKPISLKYHMKLAVVPWKHKIMKSVHIYMHNELKAFVTLSIYICIMCWQVIWNKMVKQSKGQVKELYESFALYHRKLSKLFLLNPLTALCIYIYAQSEKAFKSQCKHSIVLRHVFFKK